MNHDDDDSPVMPLAAKPAPPLPRQLPGRNPLLTPGPGQGMPVDPSGAMSDVDTAMIVALDGIEGRIEQNLVKQASALVDAEPDRVIAVLRRWLNE